MEMINNIIHGDCLEVMKDIPDQSIDMILCDLPYQVTGMHWDAVIPFEMLWEQYGRIIKDNRAIVLTASQPFTSALVMSKPELFKYEWIWQKNAGSNFTQVKRQPMKEHESVLVFGKEKVRYFPIMQERQGEGKDRATRKHRNRTTPSDHLKGILVESKDKLKYLNELRYPSSVQKFNRERGLHPTQKPVALFEYLIKTYTNEGDIILDNCIGSGTTAIAALNTGRFFIGIEKEEKYVDIARRRIEDHQYKLV
jgi:site-specific DNA-methyltransferase (adenine-specific)